MDLIYHVLNWHSSKQSRISFSSIGSEILAAATSADRSASMTEGLQALHGADTSLPLVLTVDSLDLHATITTVHEGKDYRLRPTVARRLLRIGRIFRYPVDTWTETYRRCTHEAQPCDVLVRLNSICLSGRIDRQVFTPCNQPPGGSQRYV